MFTACMNGVTPLTATVVLSVTAPPNVPTNLNKAAGAKAQLEELRKGDREKVKMARRLRQETTVPWAWIAKQLSMGTAGNAANLVRAGF
jgi:hypothetical protein